MSATFDLVMHGVGRQIDLSRPRHRSEFQTNLSEDARIPQGGKNPRPVGPDQVAHVDDAFKAIDEADRDICLADGDCGYYTPWRHGFDILCQVSGAILIGI